MHLSLEVYLSIQWLVLLGLYLQQATSLANHSSQASTVAQQLGIHLLHRPLTLDMPGQCLFPLHLESMSVPGLRLVP